jgi:hypothetical protein
VLMPLHPQYNLVSVVIGYRGAPLQDIWWATGARIRVRGRGSRYLETCSGSEPKEADCRLHAVLTTGEKDPAYFLLAVQMMVAHLQAVNKKYDKYCRDRQLIGLLQDQSLFGFGRVSHSAWTVLGSLRAQWPLPVAGPRHTPLAIPDGEDRDGAEQLPASDRASNRLSAGGRRRG